MKKQLDCKALKQGFTLIELTIVIAIIGLMVGGIAGLRTYVRSAQLNGLMNDAKIYITAFNQFQTRYNAPPGDYSTASSAWTGAGDGDGNGIIWANGVAAGNTAEYYYVFQHLALAGYITGTYKGVANSFGGATAANSGGSNTSAVNIPAAPMENAAYLFTHPPQVNGIVSGDPIWPDGVYGNVLGVAGLDANSAGVPVKPFLTAKQTYQLDDKYDDGLPFSGNMLVVKTASLPYCTSGTAYAGGADKTCYFVLKMQ